MTTDHHRCTDEELRMIAEQDPNQMARSAATELIAIRAERRRDSRRAEQLRKLRWVAEAQLVKIEALTARWGAEPKSQAADDEHAADAPGGAS